MFARLTWKHRFFLRAAKEILAGFGRLMWTDTGGKLARKGIRFAYARVRSR